MECWFCEGTHELWQFERESNGAPYLNDDGTPQMICRECRDHMRAYRETIGKHWPVRWSNTKES